MIIQKENIYGWAGYRMTSGDVSLGITPQIGGRIISLTHQGEELLFVQDEFKGDTYSLEGIDDLRAKKCEMGFRLWGGDKTWVAPQNEWWENIPPLDLDAGEYSVKIDENVLEMTSPICRETGLRIIRRITLGDERIHLRQTFRNETDNRINRGIWDVTQVLKPFDVYLPASLESIKAYKDEGKIEDAKKKMVEKDGWVKILCDDDTHFKVGGLINKGVVVALREKDAETLAFSRVFNIDSNHQYAHGAIVEVYNSPKYDYFEVEVHAPLISLDKGEEATHSQTWALKRFKGSVKPEQVAKILEGKINEKIS